MKLSWASDGVQKRRRERKRGEARKAYCEVTDGLAVENKSNFQPLLLIFLKSSLLLSSQPQFASCLFPCCFFVAAQVLLVFGTMSAGLECEILLS